MRVLRFLSNNPLVLGTVSVGLAMLIPLWVIGLYFELLLDSGKFQPGTFNPVEGYKWAWIFMLPTVFQVFAGYRQLRKGDFDKSVEHGIFITTAVVFTVITLLLLQYLYLATKTPGPAFTPWG